MQVLSAKHEVQQFSRAERLAGRTIGVVPTMGALHEGHISLIRAARAACETVIVTIFVNPTQFAPDEDLDRYPRSPDADLDGCRGEGADLVFCPSANEMYTPDAQTTVTVQELTRPLEGASRPAHFAGVTTVVAKLLNITLPDRAYFGRKDYQQQLIVRRMCRDLDWPVEIVTCPIVRDTDGLALSSRNRYLSAEERRAALVLSRSLALARQLAQDGTPFAAIERQMADLMAAEPLVQTEYAVVADRDTLQPPDNAARTAVALLAARVGSTRLIDNELLSR